MPKDRPSLAVYLVLLPAVVLSARAGAADEAGWTLAALLEHVSRSDPRVRALDARISAASAEVDAASVAPNPSIGWEREDVFLGDSGQSDDFVRIEWPLDLSGRRGLRADAARAGVEVARAAVAAERTELLLDAALVLMEAARRRARLEILREAAEAVSLLVESQRRRHRAGSVKIVAQRAPCR